MEGKAILFKYLGGVDAFPLCINTEGAAEMIRFVKQIQPTFGGINLEDIEKPKCFEILDTLREEAEIPVWHDDQQGTAAVTLAGLINAVKIVGKPLDKVKIGMLGIGASNQRIAIMLAKAGVDPSLTYMCDSRGILYKGREDLAGDKYKAYLADITNGEKRTGGPAEAFEGVDVMIALSKPGPDTVKPEWIRSMNKDSIVFTCANPIPEIWPWEAKEAGARIVATGRSDFANQVNNSLGFPGIFRGTPGCNGHHNHRRDVHRRRPRARQGSRGQRHARRLPHPHHGRVGGLPQRGRSRRPKSHRARRRPTQAHPRASLRDRRKRNQKSPRRNGHAPRQGLHQDALTPTHATLRSLGEAGQTTDDSRLTTDD